MLIAGAIKNGFILIYFISWAMYFFTKEVNWLHTSSSPAGILRYMYLLIMTSWVGNYTLHYRLHCHHAMHATHMFLFELFYIFFSTPILSIHAHVVVWFILTLSHILVVSIFRIWTWGCGHLHAQKSYQTYTPIYHPNHFDKCIYTVYLHVH